MAFIKLLKRLITPTTFIAIGAVARILPHPPNFAPIAGMALFGGAYLDKKEALTLPIIAMIFSDLFIGFDSLPMRLTVYGSFLAIVLVGFRLKKNHNFRSVFAASLASSLLFFLTTNFAVWAFGSFYPKNIFGLAESYTLAIPFFKNTLLGDLFYTGAFFGGYEFLKSLSKVKSKAFSPS